MTKTVLHIFGRMDRGGAELRTLDVVRGLDPSEFRTVFLTLKAGPGALDEEARALGARVVECPLDLAFPARLLRQLRREHPTIVHSHVHDFSGLILMLAAFVRVPARIAHYRSSGDGKRPTWRRRLQRTLMRALVDRFATQILAVSVGAMEAAKGPLWTADPRCKVIYNGVDVGRLSAGDGRSLRATLTLGSEPVVLMLANASPAKNHVRAMAIFGALRSMVPRVRLVLAGDGSFEEAERALSLADRSAVINLGLRTDIADLLAAADALLLTSVREGLPGAVLESLAAGTPVVATRLPGVVEISERVTGVVLLDLAQPDEAWANALRETLANPPAIGKVEGTDFDLACSRASLVETWMESAG
jgi:glycosyltransferase involved in cell wall biosynthesis